MNNILQHTTDLALAMCEKYIQKDGLAVDCTCGNGKDTLWLAKRCKRVMAFDIQKSAIDNTQALLHAENITCFNLVKEDSPACVSELMRDGVYLVQDSHEHLAEYLSSGYLQVSDNGLVEALDAPCVIIFNLGFLPGGDKNVTTKVESSVNAIKKALDVLDIGGLLSVTMYPGHSEGRAEQDAVLEWAKGLDSGKYHCVFANMLNQSDRAPQVLWITKKK